MDVSWRWIWNNLLCYLHLVDMPRLKKILLIIIGIYCIIALGWGSLYTKIPININLPFPIFPSEVILCCILMAILLEI